MKWAMCHWEGFERFNWVGFEWRLFIKHFSSLRLSDRKLWNVMYILEIQDGDHFDSFKFDIRLRKMLLKVLSLAKLELSRSKGPSVRNYDQQSKSR